MWHFATGVRIGRDLSNVYLEIGRTSDPRMGVPVNGFPNRTNNEGRFRAMGIDAVMGREWPTLRASASSVINPGQRSTDSLVSGCSWASPPLVVDEPRPDQPFLDLELGDDDEVDLEQQTILVVDDDSGIRDALTDILDQLGYSVVAAANGVEALDALQGGCEPSAVLLDLEMPTMDGREFRDELLRDPRFCRLPVIVITASRNQRPEELHVTDVLTKPVQLSRLLDILETHFPKVQPY